MATFVVKMGDHGCRTRSRTHLAIPSIKWFGISTKPMNLVAPISSSRHRIPFARWSLKAAILLVWLVRAGEMAGQGLVQFRNSFGTTFRSPVYGVAPTEPFNSKLGNSSNSIPAGPMIYEGPLLAGTGYTAELWAGPVGSSQYELVPVPGARATFRTASGNVFPAGFITPPAGSIAVPGIPAGSPARFQWRVWENRGGIITNWSQVFQCCCIARGSSVPFDSPPLGDQEGILLTGLTSFGLFLCLACDDYETFTVQSSVPGGNAVEGETVTFAHPYPGHCDSWRRLQWHWNGLPIPSETNRTLTLTNVSPERSGLYTFSFIRSDWTNSASAPLTVHPPPYLTNAQWHGGNMFSATLVGAPSRNCAVESSTNLGSWSSFVTLANPTGQTSFSESNVVSGASRFFRARVLP